MADRATVDALVIGGLTLGIWAWLKSKAATTVQTPGGIIVQPVSYTQQPKQASVLPIPQSLLDLLGLGTPKANTGAADLFGAQLDASQGAAGNPNTVQGVDSASSFFGTGAATAPASGGADVLARTIWGEARGEGAAGMQAVANVIVNRVRSPRFPNTVEGVCYQRNQFSMWNAGDPNGAKAAAVTTADPAFAQAVQIAAQAIAGTLPDLTGGALHYYAASIAPPYWAALGSGQVAIGNHVFVQGVA